MLYNLGVIVTISSGLHSPEKEEGKELTVTSFKYLEATISNEGPKPEILYRNENNFCSSGKAQAEANMER